MYFPILFSNKHRIILIDCEVKEDKVISKLSRITPYLSHGAHVLKANAITPICQILLPDWAVSDEPLIFLEPLELEIYHA